VTVNALEASVLDWQRALTFLVDDLGFAAVSTVLRPAGYQLRYAGAAVGVEVSYEVRDSAAVWLYRLDVAPGWDRLGEIGPGTPINRASLRDLEAVGGRRPTPVIWSIPSSSAVAAYATSLRAEGDLLRGDFTALEVSADLVRARARLTAEAKWGATEARRRWGDPEQASS
jgi:hypothetical protein